MRIAPAALAIALAAPAALADVVRLVDGQVISGTVKSCEDGNVVFEPPAARAVLLKIADISTGEGAGIERCLSGRTGGAATIRESNWYGVPIIIVGASSLVIGFASLVLTAGQGSAGAGGGVLLGATGLLFAPAVIHAIHGKAGTAVGSVGMHLGLGLGGALLGAALTSCPINSDTCGLRGAGNALAGLVIAQLVATTIDAASLAYEDRPVRVSTTLPMRDAPQGRPTPAGLALALRF